VPERDPLAGPLNASTPLALSREAPSRPLSYQAQPTQDSRPGLNYVGPLGFSALGVLAIARKSRSFVALLRLRLGRASSG